MTDIVVKNEEYRIVNGKEVILRQMNYTIRGIKWTQLVYFYSNDKGSTQLVTITSRSLFNELKKEMEIMLNGLVQL